MLFRTIKIENEIFHRVLAAEFVAEEAPLAQQMPEACFGVGLQAAKFARIGFELLFLFGIAMGARVVHGLCSP
jgi:hypothetical protein